MALPRRSSPRRRLACVLIAMTLGAGAGPHPGQRELRDAREFRPSLHGFKFVNSFTGCSLPLPGAIRTAATESGIMRVLGAPERFGLCGGMSLAAAELYEHGEDVPAADSSPAQGSGLFEYVYDCQLRSLGPLASCIVKFLDWMHLPTTAGPGADSCASRTLTELPRLRERLTSGRFAQVGLVFRSAADGPGSLWRNHQVLAYAWEEGERDITIRIYDPNFPLDDNATLVIANGALALSDAAYAQQITVTRHATRRQPRPVRGIFDIPIRLREPSDLTTR